MSRTTVPTVRADAHRRYLRRGRHATRPEVEPEPDEKPEDIQDLLDDAEMIVEAAEPEALRELGRGPGGDRKWWQVWKRR